MNSAYDDRMKRETPSSVLILFYFILWYEIKKYIKRKYLDLL